MTFNYVDSFIFCFNFKLLLLVFLGPINCNFGNSFNVSPPLPASTHAYLEGNRNTLRHCDYLHNRQIPKKYKIEINCYDALQILIVGPGVLTLFWLPYINLCTHVSYVTFNTDLNLYNKKKK